MKKFLKFTLGTLLLVIVGLTLFGYIISEKEPIGKTGPEAEKLAQQMLASINVQQWQSTNYVQWSFKNMHHFLWDKQRNWCKVTWSNNEVYLILDEIDGKAFIDGQAVNKEENEKLVKEAWGYFCNDSFWLNAPAKAFDPGTERSIVTLKDGRTGLKVKYNGGGVTPGDSYVWILDKNNRPTSYKMWVNIIPIGGLEFSWENYVQLSSGALIASLHQSKFLNIEITNLKSGNNYNDMGFTTDPFETLN